MHGRDKTQDVICQVCKQPKKPSDVMPAELVREPIVSLIQRACPDWSSAGFICTTDLNRFRNEYVQEILKADKGELSDLEEEVIRSLRDQELLSENVNTEFEGALTIGQRLADGVAQFGGSWPFIILFAIVLGGWIALNSIALLRRPFDPFPFILLNLVLSCLAAIQAPIIMMSQNRQASKDRLRAEHDYRVNLKAELEVRHLNQKMDQLLKHQWQRLLDIQQIQTDIISELTQQRSRPPKP
jgi:uncharacterized membrane protein